MKDNAGSVADTVLFCILERPRFASLCGAQVTAACESFASLSDASSVQRYTKHQDPRDGGPGVLKLLPTISLLQLFQVRLR